MYYEYPEIEEAYKFKDQYFFGNEMIVAPVTSPEDPGSIRERVEIEIELQKENRDFLEIMNGFPKKINRLKRGMLLLNTLWPKEWSPDSLIDAFQTGNRIEINPQNAK